MNKNLDLCLLLDSYKDLLTEKQAEILRLYLDEDLSLAEIAENYSISRQGAWRFIVAAEKKLLELEAVLGLSRKTKMQEEILLSVNQIISQGHELNCPQFSKILKSISELLAQLD